jgi:hypothetical protein
LTSKKNRKRIQDSDEALTSIVVTVMLIGIIMGLIIGPILTIQIPNEIKANEAEHMDDISESFIGLRGTINTLIREDEVGVNAPTRIQLGTKTNNFLDVGSTGSVFIEPFDSEITVFDTEDNQSIFAIGSGRIGYRSNNIYFNDQTYIFENNGIIIEQNRFSTINTGPIVEIIKDNATNNLSLSTTIVHIVGNPDTLGGSKSQIIQTTLMGAETNIYDWTIPENITINIETSYPQAWKKYYNNFLTNTSKLNSGNFEMSIFEDVNEDQILSIQLKKVNYLNVVIAVINTEIV